MLSVHYLTTPQQPGDILSSAQCAWEQARAAGVVCPEPLSLPAQEGTLGISEAGAPLRVHVVGGEATARAVQDRGLWVSDPSGHVERGNVAFPGSCQALAQGPSHQQHTQILGRMGRPWHCVGSWCGSRHLWEETTVRGMDHKRMAFRETCSRAQSGPTPESAFSGQNLGAVSLEGFQAAGVSLCPVCCGGGPCRVSVSPAGALMRGWRGVRGGGPGGPIGQAGR